MRGLVEPQDTTKSKTICKFYRRHHTMRVRIRGHFSETMVVDTIIRIIIIIVIMTRAEEVSHQTVIPAIGATKRDIISKIVPLTTTPNMSLKKLRYTQKHVTCSVHRHSGRLPKNYEQDHEKPGQKHLTLCTRRHHFSYF